jgi:hypothetical protein
VKAARIVTRRVPLPTNVAGVSGRVATLEDIPDAVVVGETPPGPPARRSPARTVHAEPHPAFIAAAARDVEQRQLRAATLDGWALDTEFGLPISPTGALLVEAAWGAEQLAATGIMSARRLPRASTLEGRVASLISQWCEHYYHWFADAVPRLLVLEKLGLADAPLLVPRRVSAYERDSLRLLGVDVARIIPASSAVVRPEGLVWPALAGPSGHPPAWACREIGTRLRQAAGVQAGGTRRLFISRRLAAHRRIVNEAELVAALEPFGFEVVTPEELSLGEQVRAFAGAKLVVAPHGAGLANMLFANDATAVEIHEPDNLNLCFYNLADAAGHAYWYVLGERFAGHRVGPSYRDIRAPIDAVVATVTAILTK